MFHYSVSSNDVRGISQQKTKQVLSTRRRASVLSPGPLGVALVVDSFHLLSELFSILESTLAQVYTTSASCWNPGNGVFL